MGLVIASSILRIAVSIPLSARCAIGGGVDLRRIGIVAALLVALSVPANTQQRTFDEDAPGTIHRQWPDAGVWGVLLTTALDRHLSCVMATAKNDPNSGEFYLWGFRYKGDAFALLLSDRNQAAVAGDAIKVIVDGTTIGTFPVSKRIDQSGVSSIASDVPVAKAEVVKRLLGAGGTVKFSTGIATYSAALNGAPMALANLAQCKNEADELTALREPKKPD